MSKSKDECLFFHRQCPHGCNKVQCRAYYPERAPIIMEDQKKICQSPEHKECEQYKASFVWREERRLAKKGCPFLGDHYCGRPKLRYCKGKIPPFDITDDPNLASCYGNDYAECPNYAEGIAFQEEAKRVMERGKLKAINNSKAQV